MRKSSQQVRSLGPLRSVSLLSRLHEQTVQALSCRRIFQQIQGAMLSASFLRQLASAFVMPVSRLQLPPRSVICMLDVLQSSHCPPATCPIRI